MWKLSRKLFNFVCQTFQIKQIICSILSVLNGADCNFQTVCNFWDFLRYKLTLPFIKTFARKRFMLLRACEGKTIRLLPIYIGRKWGNYKSSKCPVWVTKMSAYLNILFQYLHLKVIVGLKTQPTTFLCYHCIKIYEEIYEVFNNFICSFVCSYLGYAQTIWCS